MAQRKKNASGAKRKIQFELTPTGAAAAAVVCVSLFFWMFFLGVWAGQSVLGPPAAHKEAVALPKKKTQSPPPVFTAAAKKTAPTAVPAGPASFFTLQIGAFRDKSGAMHEIVRWKVRGEKSYLVKDVDEKGTLYRVCLGKFSELAAANGFAQKYAKKGQQPYIILLPETKFGAAE